MQNIKSQQHKRQTDHTNGIREHDHPKTAEQVLTELGLTTARKNLQIDRLKASGRPVTNLDKLANRWVISDYIESQSNKIDFLVNRRAHDLKTGQRVDDTATFAKSFIDYFDGKKFSALGMADRKLLIKGANILRDILNDDSELNKMYGNKFLKIEIEVKIHGKYENKLIAK